MNNPIATLCVYASATILASLAGGAFPSLFRLTHTRLQAALSFIAGLMLGMALLHLVPHAVEETGSVDHAMAWALAGFLTMFFLQRVFHYHQHGAPENAPTAATGCGGPRQFTWQAVALGLGFHSLLDGLALATAVSVAANSGGGWVGWGTALAVILHKPFDALAVMTLVQSNGCPAARRWALNLGLALIAPLGMLLAWLGLGESAAANHVLLGCALGFCGGGFLCIAGSDLLPELHFHAHDRIRLSLALLAGLGVAIIVGQFEPANHGHNHALTPATQTIHQSTP